MLTRCVASVLLAVGVLGGRVCAQSTAWLRGALSADWSNPLNWSAGVPTSSVDAVIGFGVVRYPVITGAAACRSLSVTSLATVTINQGGTLDVLGNVTGRLSGGGLLHVTPTTFATLSGAFENVEIAYRQAVLASGCTVSGQLTVTAAMCVASSGCVVGSLVVAPRGNLVVDSASAPPLVITRNLEVLRDQTGTGLVRNDAVSPLTISGTTHRVLGNTQGPVLFDFAAPTTITLGGTMSGIVQCRTTSQRVAFVGQGSGAALGNVTITAQGVGVLALSNVSAGTVTAIGAKVEIAGTVSAETIDLAGGASLEGGATDTLIADQLILSNGSVFVGNTVPGTVRLRRGLTVNFSTSFAPVRGIVIFDNPAQPLTATFSSGVSMFDVRVENGAQVSLQPGGLYHSFQIHTATVAQGSLTTLSGSIGNLVVQVAGRAQVRREVNGGLTPSIGNAQIAGTATFDADTVFQGRSGWDPTWTGHLWVQPDGTASVGLVAGNRLTLSGNLHVDGTFSAPPAEWIRLAGVGTLRGNAPATIVMATADVTMNGDFTARGGLDVRGKLTVPAGRRIDFAGYGLNAYPEGHLVLAGTPSAPVTIAGSNSHMDIEGRIDAAFFTFSGMDAAGVQMATSATIGAAPLDFRAGRFTGGAPGGVLLDIARTAPTTFYELDFERAGGATRNVRSATAAAISILDSTGDLSGVAFEDDPGNVIAWTPNRTAVASLTARPGVARNLLSFRTTVEEASAFRLVRTPGGPLASIAALGPGTYSVIDDLLLSGARYAYTLERLSAYTPSHWRPVPALVAAATPHAASEGVTRFVGPNGFADIATALAGAPAGTIVFVTDGSYPGFTMSQPARVIGDGAVSVTGPVTVANVMGASGDVVLDGLSLERGATLRNVTVPLILRGVAVPQSPSVSLSITGCRQTALLGCAFDRPTLLASSTVHAGATTFTALDLQQNTRLVAAEATWTSLTTDASSTLTPRTGTFPRLDASAAWPSGTTQNVAVRRGGAGFAYGLLLGASHEYWDLSGFLPYDMVLLLPLTALTVVATGVLDSSGAQSVSIPAPRDSSLVGQSVQLQPIVLDLTTVTGRFGEVRQVVLLR